MVTEISKDAHLLPDRHQQQELFICEIADTVLKGDMASMEHPIFSMSKKPDMKVREYQSGNITLTVEPSVRGIATIYDKDILIYAISKLMQAKNDGRPIMRHVSFTAYDFLIFSNRMTNGNAYEALKDAMSRLDGTRLRTNIKTGGVEKFEAFGLIDGARIKRSSDDGKVTEWGVTLSEWLFKAIEAQEVLTLHQDYFRLKKPIERRVYEIARKHCGNQDNWSISVEKLHSKSGSQSPMKQFRYLLKNLIASDHLPDYRIEFDQERDKVTFYNRRNEAEVAEQQARLRLSSGVYDQVRRVAPGWDPYVLEQRWRSWMIEGGMDAPDNPDKAFIGFCRSYFKRHGRP
jgi:plasmid replication initiation protein